MVECIECGEPTKYNGGLCTTCYNKKKSKAVEPEAPKISRSTSDISLE